MNITKYVRNTIIIAAFIASAALVSGCGGVSDTEMAQLNDLRSEVEDLQSQVNTLQDERSALEKDVAERNAKLQQCAQDKEQAKANLDKLPE